MQFARIARPFGAKRFAEQLPRKISVGLTKI